MPRQSERESSAIVAYRHVRDYVVSLDFSTSQFITEGEIAEELAMSRTPVREAFILLENEGFLRIFPKKGAFIPAVSDQEIRNIFEAREMVETYTARQCSQSASYSDIVHELTENMKLQELARDRLDQEEMTFLDRAFHVTLVQAVENSTIDQLYESLRNRQLRLAAKALAKPERISTVVDEHRRIMDAAVRGNDAETVAAIEAHLASSLDVMLG